MTPWKSWIKILTSLHFSEIYFQVLIAAFSSSCGPFSGLANIPWGKKILSLYSQILLPFLFPVPSMFSFLSCCYGCLCFFNSVFTVGPRENIPYNTSCFIRTQSRVWWYIIIFSFAKHNPFFFEIGFLWSYIINCIRHILEELDETWKVKAHKLK